MKQLLTLFAIYLLIFSPGLTALAALNAPPVVYLSFDQDLQDTGPYKLQSIVHGDEVFLTDGVKGGAVFIGGTEDWLDLEMDEAIFLEGGASFEFWFKADRWKNPYAGGAGFKSLVSVSGSLIVDITAEECPVAPPRTLVATVSYPLTGVAGSDVMRAYTKPNVVRDNVWIHSALVYDQAEGSLTIYMNGVEIDRAYGVPAPSFNRRTIRIGTWFKANQAFRGAIDELKIYDYPLTATAVAEAAKLSR